MMQADADKLATVGKEQAFSSDIIEKIENRLEWAKNVYCSEDQFDEYIMKQISCRRLTTSEKHNSCSNGEICNKKSTLISPNLLLGLGCICTFFVLRSFLAKR
jgi:hypothetical protein